MPFAIGFALAAVVGLALGLLGGGGAILTVPVFVYGMGFETKQAIAMSLPVVGLTSLAAAVGYWQAGFVKLRLALVFGAFAMAGALVGTRLAFFVSGTVQLTALSIIMVAAGTYMLRSPPRPPPESELPPEPTRWVALACVGTMVGVLTGLVGVGGGFLFVPALILLCRLPAHTAVGTSLVVIALNTAAAAAGYAARIQVPWAIVGAFTAIAIAGSVAGGRIGRRLPQGAIRRGFAYFLFILAAFILYENHAA